MTAGVRWLRPWLGSAADGGHVALTFATGPDPVSTPYVVDALASAQVKATFFVVGERLHRHRWLGRLLSGAGHELAVHGWRHRPLTPGRATRRALRRTVDLIADVTGVAPRWVCPAYGLLLPGVRQIAAECGLEPVLCGSWRPTAALCGGSTVLLRDRCRTEAAWRAGLAAVPLLVARCRLRGLRVGPLREHGLQRPAPGAGD